MREIDAGNRELGSMSLQRTALDYRLLDKDRDSVGYALHRFRQRRRGRPKCRRNLGFHRELATLLADYRVF